MAKKTAASKIETSSDASLEPGRMHARGANSQQRVLWAALFAQGLNGRRGLPYVLVGEPGSAKTSSVRQLAGQANLAFEGVLGSLRSPIDFLGVPVPRKRQLGVLDQHLSPDGEAEFTYMHYAPAGFSMRAALAKRAVILLDEVNTCPPSVQAALLRVLFEGVVGELELPPGVRMLLAMNETKDAAGGWDIAPPLANRMGWLEWSSPTPQEFTRFLLNGGRGAHLVQNADGEWVPGETVDPIAEEAAVDALWPKAWAISAGEVSGFLHRRGELLLKRGKEGDRQWPSPRCYDAETEVLTAEGFQRWADVRPGQMLATLLPSGEMQFATPAELYSAPYDGPAWRVQAQHVDLLVTPGHTMLTSRDRLGGQVSDARNQAKEDFELVSVDDLVSELNQRPTFAARFRSDADWFETDLPSGKLFGNVRDGTHRYVAWGDWAEFLGWWLTDGGFSKKQVRVTQVRSDRRARVHELLTRMGFDAVEYEDRIACSDPLLFAELLPQGKKHDGGRFIPGDLRHASAQTLRRLLAGVMGGDGWHNSGTDYACVGPNARLAADLQELAIKTGGTGRVTSRLTKKGTRVYTVAFMTTRYARPRLTAENFSQEHYSGTVYCARMEPHHTLLVRRNGHAVWSGNTWELTTRALAGSYVYDLTPIEREMACAAFVGSGAFGEFFSWRKEADLPDPEALLDGQATFEHRAARLDRTAAVLTACTAIVTPENAPSRKERSGRLWHLIRGMTADATDVCLPAVIALCNARLMGGSEEAYHVLANIEPVMSAAGITKVT